MANPPIDDSSVNRTITFTTKSDNDSTVWRGMVSGIINRQMAQMFTDLVQYNESVRRVDSDVPASLDALHYFALVLDNSSAPATTKAFAYEWIADGTLVFLDAGRKVYVEITEPTTNDPEDILTVLKASGYKNSRIVKTVPL